MRIVHIVPGSGGSFYCENCLRDNVAVKAMLEMGHDVTIVPLYLPLFADSPEPLTDSPVFFGAVSLYLREKIPLLRRFPIRWLRFLNAAPILRWAAKQAGRTRASGMEDMTLSMLRGENGRQAAELEQLVVWLKKEGKPDVVHLSNALLLGLARRIRRELSVPIVCALQDEDTWIDPMGEPVASRIWEVLNERSEDVDVFVSVSHAYGEKIAHRMQSAADRFRTVHIGIDTEGYAPPGEFSTPVTIGYLSRLSRAGGLDILLEAFILLKKDPRFQDLRLLATGGSTADDREFIAELHERAEAAGVADSFDILSDFGRPQRIDFLRSVRLLSVPMPGGEAFGTYLLEAMACGVPAVQPNVGAFPEIIEATGGGVTYEPNTPERLAETLAGLLSSPERLRGLGNRGREAVLTDFSVERMAWILIDIYRELLAR